MDYETILRKYQFDCVFEGGDMEIFDKLLKNSWGIFTKGQNKVKCRDALREHKQDKLLCQD